MLTFLILKGSGYARQHFRKHYPLARLIDIIEFASNVSSSTIEFPRLCLLLIRFPRCNAHDTAIDKGNAIPISHAQQCPILPVSLEYLQTRVSNS